MGAWNFFNPLLVLLALAVGAYFTGLVRLQRRSGGEAISRSRIFFASAGFTMLFLALVGPFDVYSGDLFFVHMIQHMLLTMAAAPLLLASSPMPAYMWSLPETVRMGVGSTLSGRGLVRRLIALVTRPMFTLPLYVLTLWLWHMPAAYSLALENDYVHFLEHASMFGVGVLFWWPIIGPSPVRSSLSYPQRMIYVMLVVTPMAVLAAFLTLAHDVSYHPYLLTPEHWGISKAEDQGIAGMIMWIPGNVIFLAAVTVIFFKWFDSEEKKSREQRRASRRLAPRDDAGKI